MRILFVARKSRVHVAGGMEDHLETLTRELASRGHDIHVVTARHPDGIREQTVEGVRWIHVDSPPDQGSRWATALVEAIGSLSARLTFDVIHSQSTSAVPLLHHRDRSLPPIVLCLHGNYGTIVQTTVQLAVRNPSPHGLARAVVDLAAISRIHFRNGQWWRFSGCEATVPSQSQVSGACWSHRLRRERVHVVWSGIDAQLFRPLDREAVRASLGLPHGVPIALAVGRLDRGKGIEIAVEALARLHQLPSVKLVVVGGGPRRVAIEELAVRRGVRERVSLVGHVPMEEVARYMAAADTLVFPSLLAEAGPLVIPQALACEIPVIGSSIGAVPEMLGDGGEAGLLFRPGSASGLAEALRTLLCDEPRRRKMGARGRERVLERMTIERMADGMCAVYQRAIESRRARSAEGWS